MSTQSLVSRRQGSKRYLLSLCLWATNHLADVLLYCFAVQPVQLRQQVLQVFRLQVSLLLPPLLRYRCVIKYSTGSLRADVSVVRLLVSMIPRIPSQCIVRLGVIMQANQHRMQVIRIGS